MATEGGATYLGNANLWSSGVTPEYLTESNCRSGTVLPSPPWYWGDTSYRVSILERHATT